MREQLLSVARGIDGVIEQGLVHSFEGVCQSEFWQLTVPVVWSLLHWKWHEDPLATAAQS